MRVDGVVLVYDIVGKGICSLSKHVDKLDFPPNAPRNRCDERAANQLTDDVTNGFERTERGLAAIYLYKNGPTGINS